MLELRNTDNTGGLEININGETLHSLSCRSVKDAMEEAEYISLALSDLLEDTMNSDSGLSDKSQCGLQILFRFLHDRIKLCRILYQEEKKEVVLTQSH